jgi:D-3-phosphoglycerate dehydrogenase
MNYVNAPAVGRTGIRYRPGPAARITPTSFSARSFRQGNAFDQGALFLRKQPRIVLLDDYRIDALPSGPALILSNRDIQGVIGKVGTLLGESGINIAEWQMGRSARGGLAVSFINIDDRASDDVLKELRALPPILDVRQVTL